MVNKMKKMIHVLVISLLSLTIFSCAKKSNTSSTVEGTGQADNTETCSSDIITPSVTSVIPNDGVSSVALDTNISITFSIKMDDRFVKASTIGSWCLSSIQVSSDNFSGCVKMSSDPTTDDNKTFSFTPSSNLDNGSNYKIKVTTAAVEYCNWTPLSSEYITPSGFTTID